MSRRRVNRIMKAGGMASSYSRARYRPHPARPNDDPAPNILGREFDGYAPAHAHRRQPGLRGGSAVHGRAYACPASSRTARSRATPSGRGATRISCWPRSPRCASRWAASRCSTPTGAAGSPGNASNECSTCSASRVSCRIPAAPTTTRWSNPPTVSSEGARIRQHVHERGTTALGRQPVRMVVQPPAAPLDPRIHEPRGVHQTRKHPLETVQHTVANPSLTRS